MDDILDIFNDNVTVIETDNEEQKDAMGDLPDWGQWELNDFITKGYRRTYRKGTPVKWSIIESGLGDGSWRGKNTYKDDVLTDSVDQLAKREMTMHKLLKKEEVESLKTHILRALNNGDNVEDAMQDSMEVVYERAREQRLALLRENKEVTNKFLLKTGSGITLKQIYDWTLEFTKNVNLESGNVPNASSYRKEMNRAYIEMLKTRTGVKAIYGRPWAWFNSLYWNTLFGWTEKEPNQILQDCARRYAYSLSWDEQVNGTEVVKEWNELW